MLLKAGPVTRKISIRRNRRAGILGFILLAIMLTAPAAAEEIDAALQTVPLTGVFPGAEHTGKTDGTPPSAPVFSGQRLVGYLFLTSQVVDSAGYAGKPVKILAGIDLEGRLTGAAVVEHQEPILVLGIDESKLQDFLAQLRGIDVRRTVRLGQARSDREVGIDAITGASITSMVFNDSVIRSARAIGRARGIMGSGVAAPGGGRLDLETYREASWPQLLDDGSIRNLHLTNAQVDQAFANLGGPAGSAHQRPEDTFVDLYVGLATPPTVGQNLLGFAEFGRLRRELTPGGQVIFVAATGFYSFRGYSYRRSGVFDRIQLVQGDKTIQLTKAMHRRIDQLRIANAPELREKSFFIIPDSAGFEPTRPWRLELLAERSNGSAESRFVIFPVSYDIPPAYLRQAAVTGAGAGAGEPETYMDDLPLWQRRWLDSIWPISVLAIALTALLALLVFQDYAARQPNFLRFFRVGFLVFTLIFLGWVLSAQLSVINVLTFTSALLTGFRWEFFLLEPLIFILWSFVAVALLFWGRGVFCGWLCPFGALQELLSRVARFFKVPQLKLPFGLNERLWPLKYVAFLGLLAVSLGPSAMTTTLAEIEPFKTTISLKFVRAWPFVAYAGVLLVASLFVQRVFCRYVCPLGGALAIPSGQHMFDWLKRRRQCGSECNICAASCPVQAIHPNGAINAHECIYCLDCQSLYYDDHKCPPLIERRKRREERRRRREQRQAEKQATG